MMKAYFSHVTTCTKITGGLGKSLMRSVVGTPHSPIQGPFQSWLGELKSQKDSGPVSQKRNKKIQKKKDTHWLILIQSQHITSQVTATPVPFPSLDCKMLHSASAIMFLFSDRERQA